MIWLQLMAAAVLGYLIGSIPSGVLVSRALVRRDVRTNGSGHTGGLNTYRTAGLIGGVLTALLDVGKGILSTWLAARLFGSAWAPSVAGIATVVGHCWSLYIGFAGGMGLAAVTGPVVLQQPLLPVLAGGIWYLTYRLVGDRPRSVILMSVVMALVFGIAGYLRLLSPQIVLLGIGGLGVIVIRHLTELSGYDSRSAALTSSDAEAELHG